MVYKWRFTDFKTFFQVSVHEKNDIQINTIPLKHVITYVASNSTSVWRKNYMLHKAICCCYKNLYEKEKVDKTSFCPFPLEWRHFQPMRCLDGNFNKSFFWAWLRWQHIWYRNLLEKNVWEENCFSRLSPTNQKRIWNNFEK